MANLRKINEILRKKKISHQELADGVGISRPTISTIMRRNNTTTQTIESIARYLNVPVGYFFDEVGEDGAQLRTQTNIHSPNCVNGNVTQQPPAALEILADKDRKIRELTDRVKELEASNREQVKQITDLIGILKKK